MQPRFITLEGGEGAGKSTQLTQLAAAFQRAGIPVITTREPGGSRGAEAIRSLVVNGAADTWEPVTEALLFMAARYDHVHTLIKPALAKGRWVLCDRFYDSTHVYQGVAKNVGTDWLDALYTQLLGNFVPDFTLLLDMDPAQGLQRTQTRGNKSEARFESMGIAYHQRVREGFLARAKSHPQRIQTIDAACKPTTVHNEIIRTLNKRFGLSLS